MTICAQAMTGVGIEMATWEHLSKVKGVVPTKNQIRT